MNRTKVIAVLRVIALIGVYGGLLMPLVFVPIVIFPFVFSKLIFFQALIGITFPAYLLLAWMEPMYRPSKHPLYLAIFAYFLAVALSVVFAVDPYRAWWGNQERMNGLFSLLHFFAWLTMAVSLVRSWDQWKKLLHFEVALSVFMAIIPILQLRDPNLLLFPAVGRPGGLLDNPIYMACYQIFNFFFIAILFLRTKSRNVRIWLVIAGLFDVIAFLLAQSRGALAGLGVGIIVTAFFYGLFNANKKARLGILAVLGTLALAYGGVYLARNVPIIHNSPLSRFVDIHSTIDTRLIAWQIAWDGFLERPLVGWGFDNFHILFNLKYNPNSLRFSSYETWFDRSHNEVLDVLSMTGLIGLITFISIFGCLFICVVRAYRKKRIELPIAALLMGLPVAYFVQNLFVFDHPAAFTVSYLLFALVIVATSGGFEPNGLPYEERGKERSFSWLLGIVLYLFFLLVVWRTDILPFQASRLSLMANAVFSQDSEFSYDLAYQASQIATPYIDEQTYLGSKNLIDVLENNRFTAMKKGKEYYALIDQLTVKELSQQPRNTNPWYIAARLAQSMGQVDPSQYAISEQRYHAAIELSPKRQQLFEGLARLYLMEHRPDDALAAYKQAVDFDPEVGQEHWLYGLSLVYDKNAIVQGAQEILKAFSVPYAYSIQDPREYEPYVNALATVNSTSDYELFLKRLHGYPSMPADLAARTAYQMDQNNRADMRDRFLEITSEDPTIRQKYEQIKAGKATSTK